YADNNVDEMMQTSAEDVFTPTLVESSTQTYAAEVLAITAALTVEVDGTPRWELLSMTEQQFTRRRDITTALNLAPGGADGQFNGVAAVIDPGPPYTCSAPTCIGTDCRIAWIVSDLARGTNTSGFNASPGIPGLAATCQWGRAGF